MYCILIFLFVVISLLSSDGMLSVLKLGCVCSVVSIVFSWLMLVLCMFSRLIYWLCGVFVVMLFDMCCR